MIKVTLGEEQKQDVKPFPKLMINEKGCIRLVLKKGDSLILVSVCGDDFAYQKGNQWSMNDFTDYNGPVTIQNA